MKKRILCFGDSNTWGHSPKDGHRMDERWTRCLAAELENAEILEEGLNSRNAICKDAHMPWKYGFDSWKMMLLSHKPLDLVILMLGTNDLKSNYHCSAKYIACGLREYVREWMNPTLYEGTTAPKLLVVSPILLGEELVGMEGESGNFSEYSLQQSRLLAQEIRKALAPYPAEILDASEYAGPSGLDGIHMDEENHQKLAAALCGKVREMLKEDRNI